MGDVSWSKFYVLACVCCTNKISTWGSWSCAFIFSDMPLSNFKVSTLNNPTGHVYPSLQGAVSLFPPLTNSCQSPLLSPVCHYVVCVLHWRSQRESSLEAGVVSGQLAVVSVWMLGWILTPQNLHRTTGPGDSQYLPGTDIQHGDKLESHFRPAHWCVCTQRLRLHSSPKPCPYTTFKDTLH